MQDKQLIERAIDMMAFAHAPYSGFTVGAALLCDDGSVYGGCNVECSSYGATICAERTALVKAVSEGKKRFVALAVCSSSDAYCTPCGICRQMFNDFSPSMRVLCANNKGEYITKTVSELLPYAFSEEVL
ncbi:MAG: cytidine deaminase [Clostridia bacterium]|nr:cytidine deaminase [Clostridia bacterium]